MREMVLFVSLPQAGFGQRIEKLLLATALLFQQFSQPRILFLLLRQIALELAGLVRRTPHLLVLAHRGIAVGGNGLGSTPGTISGVEIDHNVNDGIEIYSPTTSAINVTTEFNRIHDNGNCAGSPPPKCAGHGIQMDGPGTQTDLIQANLLLGNLGDGVNVNSAGTFNVTMYNNTIASNKLDGILGVKGRLVAFNNLLYNNAVTSGYEFEVPSTVTAWASDYNEIYHAAGGNFMSWSGTPANYAGWLSASSQDTHSLNSDPMLTNPGSGDFTLLPASPVIDSGLNLGAMSQNALLPGSVWPNGTIVGSQNSFGMGWEMGAYIFAGQGVSVSGNLKDPALNNVTAPNSFVRFCLQNYGANIPRVISTGAVVAACAPNFLPDTSGNISGSIQPNDTISPSGTFYRVCVYNQGAQFRCNNYAINIAASSFFNLDTATPR